MHTGFSDGGTRSGPAVACLFQRLLALTFLTAWASLGVQLLELIGSRGLLPADAFMASAARSASAGTLPTVFWLGVSDRLLQAGVWAGIVIALAALCGLYPRVCFAASTALYLSYATVARTFLSFQWDNLLLECGALAVLLRSDREQRWVHLLFRVLLLKLYWESGIAKWQSHLGDWQDGSAMTYYFETAPLPTWLAWYAHALPETWHHFESWAVLALELGLPIAIFAPRSAQLVTAALFTGFQIANIVTANYGFFAYLSIVLNVFLLADRDLRWMPGWLVGFPLGRQRFRADRHCEAMPSTAAYRWTHRFAAAVVVTVYVSVSASDAWVKFSRSPTTPPALVESLRDILAPFRIINTYHLFGHITRERIEPEFQTFDGHEWYPLLLEHKPGDPLRAPDFVAPHQPRVDFQLWFYGLGFRHGTPSYVGALADRLCNDPAAVRRLFATPLSVAPEAVRIVFWQYHFTTPAERRASGAWWKRTQVATSRAQPCR